MFDGGTGVIFTRNLCRGRMIAKRFREQSFQPKAAAARIIRRSDERRQSAIRLNQNWLRADRRCRGAVGCFVGLPVPKFN